MTGGSRRHAALLAAACLAFILLATANSGGYRYGIGDQAFYEPATQLRLHPDFFPRDRALLESQARLTVVDEALAGAAHVTGLAPSSLFLALYVLGLATLGLAGAQFARVLGFSPWAMGVFLTLLTLRHRIAKTGANTLEGYMHPRQLAFAVGLLALTASLKNRWTSTVALWALAAVIHPTTALWVGALIVGGVLLAPSARSRALVFYAALAMLTIAAALIGARLQPLLHLPAAMFMDADWRAVFADKDYIFISQWPLYAWALNLAYVPLIWFGYRRRQAAGVAHSAEGRLLAGALGLFAIFAGSVWLSESFVALAVQLQVSRVFWLMDLIVAAYAAWAITSDPAVTRVTRRAPALALAAVVVFSVGRGLYTVNEGGSDRQLFRVTLPDDDWSRAMEWLKTQPADWLILADPDHAWKYGTSVRVAASRDVVLESVKDNSISLYGRDVAMRVAERTRALSLFTDKSTADIHALARRFGATVVVTESTHQLQLPRLYTNATLSVFDAR
jgi:hypothetical protein